MVRILLSPLLVLSFSAFAHDSGCNHALEQPNTTQVEAQRFLKKLQVEAESEFPASEFARIVVGSAIAPLAAGMSDVSLVPLKMNFFKPLFGEEKNNLWRVLRGHTPADLSGKNIVVMLYAEAVPSVLLFARLFISYLQENKITSKVHFRVYTSQRVLREMSKGLKEYDFSFRPIGAANEVRHLFHDGLKAAAIDVHGR
jgi:hypothetical protein